MKHTKGKWRSFTDNANSFGVTNGDTVIAIAGETDLQENEANANLIAAAPEMLELIKETVMVVEKSPSQELYPSIIRDMKEIIAKAEGK